MLTRWSGPPPGYSAVTVLAREPDRFFDSLPEASAWSWLKVIACDVKWLPADLPHVAGVVHAAWTPSATGGADTESVVGANLRGTANVLGFAARCGDIPVLFTSSGAVYGPQQPQGGPIPETRAFAQEGAGARALYAEGKRRAEELCLEAAPALAVKVARMFAFIGPHLPLDLNFAIGNFIRDAMKGEPITVMGDGTAVRSYLDSKDMVDWLWTIFERGAAGRAYNVGSERAIDIAALAHLVARRAGRGSRVEILDKLAGHQPNYYVPDTARARSELAVVESVSLEEAVDRTLAFHRASAPP